VIDSNGETVCKYLPTSAAPDCRNLCGITWSFVRKVDFTIDLAWTIWPKYVNREHVGFDVNSFTERINVVAPWAAKRGECWDKA